MVSEKKRHFVKSSIFSFSNKIMLLFIGLAYSYFIANFLGPEKYGLVVYLMNLAGTLILLFGNETLGRILTVFIPKTKSKGLFYRVIKWGLALPLMLFAIFIIFSGQITAFLNKGTPELLMLVSVLFLLMPVTLLFQALFAGFKLFGKKLKLAILENGSNLALAVLFVMVLGQGMEGVVYAKIISLGLTVAAFGLLYRKLPFKREVKESVGGLAEYATGSSLETIFKKGAALAKLVYMGLFLNPLYLGFYFLLEKISAYLIEFPIVSLAEVLLPFASEEYKDKKKMERIISLNIKFSLLLNIVASITLVLAGYFILLFLFPAYIESAYLIPLFAVYYSFTFMQQLGAVYRIRNRTDVLAAGNLLALAVFLVAGYFMISSYGLVGLLFADILRRGIILAAQYFLLPITGLKIEIVPRGKDLRYFYTSLKSLIVSRE